MGGSLPIDTKAEQEAEQGAGAITNHNRKQRVPSRPLHQGTCLLVQLQCGKALAAVAAVAAACYLVTLGKSWPKRQQPSLAPHSYQAEHVSHTDWVGLFRVVWDADA